MTFPAVTAFYGAILGLIYAGLSFWVVAGRFSANVLHGDGGNEMLNRRIRSHGNFAEYVPIILVLCALLEASGASHLVMRALLIPLVIVRLMHPVGMLARENSPQQFLFRAPGIAITFGLLIAVSILLLTRL